MLTEQAIDRFGGKARLTKLLELSSGRVYQWKETVPESSAPKLAWLSDGDLEYNPEFYKELKKNDKYWKKLELEYRRSGLKEKFKSRAAQEIEAEQAA